jgi:hypothetical protein
MCDNAPTRIDFMNKLYKQIVTVGLRHALPNAAAEIRQVPCGETFLTGDSVMTYIFRVFCSFFLALTIITAVGCASTQKQEGTGEYVDDTVISTKVRSALLGEPNLKSAEINVETFKGIVQLSGFVTSRADITKAVEVARSVNGVKSVKNDMRLR